MRRQQRALKTRLNKIVRKVLRPGAFTTIGHDIDPGFLKEIPYVADPAFLIEIPKARDLSFMTTIPTIFIVGDGLRR